MKFEYECDAESFEYSGEYLESIELCYKRIEFRRKYHLLLDICEHKLSFEAQFEPLSEKCLACDTSYETYSEASTENACGTLKLKVKNNYNIDWCEPSFSNELMLEFSQECGDPFVSAGNASTKTTIYGCELETEISQMLVTDFCKGTSILMTNMGNKKKCNIVKTPEWPGNYLGGDCPVDDNNKVKIGAVKVNLIEWTFSPELHPAGTIYPNLKINNIDAEICGGINKKIKNIVTNIELHKDNNKYKIRTYSSALLFEHGLLVDTIDNGYNDIDIPIDCESLKEDCKFCSCESSESSKPPEPEPPHSDSTSTTTSSSSSGKEDEDDPYHCKCVYNTTVSVPAATYDQYKNAGGRLRIIVFVPDADNARTYAMEPDTYERVKHDGDPVVIDIRLTISMPRETVARGDLDPWNATECTATFHADGLVDYSIENIAVTFESTTCTKD